MPNKSCGVTTMNEQIATPMVKMIHTSCRFGQACKYVEEHGVAIRQLFETQLGTTSKFAPPQSHCRKVTLI